MELTFEELLGEAIGETPLAVLKARLNNRVNNASIADIDEAIHTSYLQYREYGALSRDGAVDLSAGEKPVAGLLAAIAGERYAALSNQQKKEFYMQLPEHRKAIYQSLENLSGCSQDGVSQFYVVDAVVDYLGAQAQTVKIYAPEAGRNSFSHARDSTFAFGNAFSESGEGCRSCEFYGIEAGEGFGRLAEDSIFYVFEAASGFMEGAKRSTGHCLSAGTYAGKDAENSKLYIGSFHFPGSTGLLDGSTHSKITFPVKNCTRDGISEAVEYLKNKNNRFGEGNTRCAGIILNDSNPFPDITREIGKYVPEGGWQLYNNRKETTANDVYGGDDCIIE